MTKSKPFDTKPYSVFAYGNYGLNSTLSYSVKIPLRSYCKLKFITIKQAQTLIKKKWLEATKSKGKVYVCEVCPKEINAWLFSL